MPARPGQGRVPSASRASLRAPASQEHLDGILGPERRRPVERGLAFRSNVRMKPPVSFEGVVAAFGFAPFAYARKRGHDGPERSEDEKIDAEEFVARVLVQIPDPRRHLVRYYGAYSNRARGQRRKAEEKLDAHGSSEISQEPVPPPPERAALRHRWANLIRRAYEVDPLVCPRCGSEMRVVQLHYRPEGTQAHRGPSSQGRPPRAPLLSAYTSRWPALFEVRPIPSVDEQDGGMGGVVGRDVTHGSHAVAPCRLTASQESSEPPETAIRASHSHRRAPPSGGPKSNPL